MASESQTKPAQVLPRNDLHQPAQQTPHKKSQQPKTEIEQDDTASLEEMFSKYRGALEQVAQGHITPDRLLKVALMARSRNHSLKTCTAGSFMRCLMESAELGLEPSGIYGGAHLVPRWNSKISRNECTLVPDYRGLVELARRSSLIEAVEADVVYANDFFAYERGLKPVLLHKPILVGERGEKLGAWSVIFYKSGRTTFEVMRWDEIEKVRNGVYEWQKGPWGSWPERMGLKTVVKRALNMAPRSKALARALEIDGASDAAPERELNEVPTERPALQSSTGVRVDFAAPTKAQKLRDELRQRSPVVDVHPGETEDAAAARSQAMAADPDAEERAEIIRKEREAAEPGSNG